MLRWRREKRRESKSGLPAQTQEPRKFMRETTII
jgi:hypothetical protein